MAEDLTRLNQLRLMALQLELNQQQMRNVILITNELHQERRIKKQRDDGEKLYGKNIWVRNGYKEDRNWGIMSAW